MPRNAPLEMLTRLSTDWTDTTDAMMSVVVALVLRRLKIDTITVPIDGLSVTSMINDQVVDRIYHDVEGVPHMTIKLRPRGI